MVHWHASGSCLSQVLAQDLCQAGSGCLLHTASVAEVGRAACPRGVGVGIGREGRAATYKDLIDFKRELAGRAERAQ
jgi:hypothetical protein